MTTISTFLKPGYLSNAVQRFTLTERQKFFTIFPCLKILQNRFISDIHLVFCPTVLRYLPTIWWWLWSIEFESPMISSLVSDVTWFWWFWPTNFVSAAVVRLPWVSEVGRPMVDNFKAPTNEEKRRNVTVIFISMILIFLQLKILINFQRATNNIDDVWWSESSSLENLYNEIPTVFSCACAEIFSWMKEFKVIYKMIYS